MCRATVKNYKEDSNVVSIKLVNLGKTYQIPIELMKQYGKVFFKNVL
ncbi:hypothetical protein [Thermofilum sp.]